MTHRARDEIVAKLLAAERRICLQMVWDKDGDALAAIGEKSNLVYLWNANNQKATVIEAQPK